jgi:hypothetical protein
MLIGSRTCCSCSLMYVQYISIRPLELLILISLIVSFMVIHSDSTSVIARSNHSGARPGQKMARTIQRIFNGLLHEHRSAEIQWVKGHAGVAGNERADQLAGKAAERSAWSPKMSMAYLKLRTSKRFRAAKKAWRDDPQNHGNEEIPPPPPKKSCMDRAKTGCIYFIYLIHATTPSIPKGYAA